MTKKFNVEYQAGESRMNPAKAVDYMLVVVETEYEDVELYAEMENDTDDERATFEDLKAEIIDQAKAAGIDPEILEF